MNQMEKTESRQFSKGQIIFQQGAWEMCMYDILYGRVGIYADYGKPAQKLLVELKTEDFFGEMGLVEALPRSATAVALEDAAAYVINADNFATYFKERPATVLKVMEHLSARLRAVTNDYLDACRTVAEAVDTEAAGKEKSGWLKTQMKKLSDSYRQAKLTPPDENNL